MFTFEKSIFLTTTRTEVIMTSHNGGLSTMEDLIVHEGRFSCLIYWKVIESITEKRGHGISKLWGCHSHNQNLQRTVC